jgi:hypothetical protein
MLGLMIQADRGGGIEVMTRWRRNANELRNMKATQTRAARLHLHQPPPQQAPPPAEAGESTWFTMVSRKLQRAWHSKCRATADDIISENWNDYVSGW